MSEFDDGRLRIVQIACASSAQGPVLYALTEDGRVWSQFKATWDEEPPIPAQRSQWQRARTTRSSALEEAT